MNEMTVLVPSKFTLLSNKMIEDGLKGRVLVPSKFTLLSNKARNHWQKIIVLVPSKFTLLSNLKSQIPTSNRERDTEICAVGEI